MAYFQCMNIGSEGASVLEDLTDISLNNLTNGQILKYNTTTQKWENSDESGEIPDVQLFEALTYTEVKASSVVSPFTIANNTLTSVSSSMSDSETNILSTDTFDLTDINIIEVVVDSATFYQGGNWNGFFYVCDNDTNIRNNTYPSVAHKIMFSDTSTPLKYSLDVSQLSGQWFIGVCTGGHTNLVVSAVAIGSGLTGHVIIDKNNVDMSQRSGLQFTGNVTVTDDSTNDKTVINIQGTSIDDTTASADTTYSSSKLESDFISVSDTEEQTATDEFSTFNGGLLSSCKVTLSPIQDLHGYDNPWVGGAGKNKLDYSDSSTFYVYNGNVSITNYVISLTATGDDAYIGTYNYSDPTNGFALSPCVAGETYKLILSDNRFNKNYVTFFDSNNARISAQKVNLNNFTAPSGASKMSFRIGYEDTVSDTTYSFTVMVVKSTESDPTFEPYSNICPISGHTQVDVDVSDGQTTQEQVTVNLGGTYYSGTLDVVSGVFTPDTAKQTYPWGTYTRTNDLGNTRRRILATLSDALGTVSSDIGANISDSVEEQTGWTTDSPHFYIDSSNKTLVVFLPISTPDSTNIEVCYKLATPTPIQLSPTMVKALVGENHLSAPLEGQEITESVYSPLAKWNAVIDDTTASDDTTYSSNKTNTLLNGKVDKVAGKELSTNDYTDAEKTKLEGITAGAEVNTIASISVNGTTVTPDANRNVNIVTGGSGGDPDALTAEQVTALIALLG